MKIKFAVAAVLCLSCLLWFAAPLGAQTANTGALTVTVTDPSGAAIPSATVTTVAATGETRTLTTTAQGNCTFTLLPVGNYQVTIVASGFKAVTVPSVPVNVAETHVLSQALQIGTTTQAVTVNAAVQAIQTESSTNGDVIGQLAITSIPLTTRNFTQILDLSPGVVANVNDASQVGRGNQSTFVNGTGDISSNYQMDGTNITGFINGGTTDPFGGLWGTPPIPSPDALQEFKVQTSQYDAGYGHGAGANVNIITRSGTNNFHGSLFEFIRNDVFNANTFFGKLDGRPRGELTQNQFGGTIGGPLKKDKFFFFFSYQGTRQVNGVASGGFSTINLPPQLTDDRTAATLGKEFCPGNYAPGAPGAVYANTNFPTATNSVACNGSNINPVALAFLNAKLANGEYALPSPQTIQNAGTASAVGFSSFSVPATFNEDQGLLNFDYAISQKYTLSERFYYDYGLQVNSFQGAEPPGGAGTNVNGNFLTNTRLTTILSNTLVNEVHFAWTINPEKLRSLDPFTATQFGITPSVPYWNRMPVFQISDLGVTVGGAAQATDVGNNPYQGLEAGDQISWSHGRHTVRTGVLWDFARLNALIFGRSRGELTFATFPDFLLGMTAVQNGTSTLPQAQSNIEAVTAVINANGGTPAFLHQTYWGAFIQDDFKETNQLTWNLGLRWEYNGIPYNVAASSDQINFDYNQMLSVPIPPAGGTYVGYTAGTKLGTPLPPGIPQRGSIGYTNGHAPFTNFQPRVGFAWQPLGDNSKLVVRGGFGMFNVGVTAGYISNPATSNPPVALPYATSGVTNLQSSWAAPYYPPPSLGFTQRFQTSGLSGQEIDPNLRAATIYSESLNVQYQLPGSFVWTVGYVGNHGSQLVVLGRPLNAPQLASPSAPVNCGYPQGCITANGSGGADGPVNRLQVMGLTPYGFTDYSNGGDSEYNGLQTSLRKILSHGLQFQASYTYGRTFTDVRGSSWIAGGSFESNDATNTAQLRGPADFDRTQRFVVNYVYRLPDFYGGSGFAGKTLSGWGISGVTTVQSGNPLTLTSSGNLVVNGVARPGGGGAYGATWSRAEICPGTPKSAIYSSGPMTSRIKGFFNPAAFCAVPLVANAGDANATGFGNTSTGYATGPGQFNSDISLSKITTVGGIHEGATVEFRAEFYNAFNHPEFSSPSANSNSGAFGIISSTNVGPRIIQFGLKYLF